MSGVASASVAATNTVAPVASGSYEVGGTVSVTNGTWSNAGTVYTYAWYDCTTNVVSDPVTDGSCTANGGTASSYIVGNGDIDKYLYAVVSVNGSDRSGPYSAASNALGQVASFGSILHCALTPSSYTLSQAHPTATIVLSADANGYAPNGNAFIAWGEYSVNGGAPVEGSPGTVTPGSLGTFTFSEFTSLLNGQTGTIRFDFFAADAMSSIGQSLCHVTFSVAAQVPILTFKPVNYLIRSFASSSSQLSPLLKYEVNRLATKIINYVAHHGGTVSVKLTGYADVTGPSAFNQALSLARAKAVKALLLADLNRHHISSTMVTIGMGTSGHTQSLVNSRRVTAYVTSALIG
jgi:hypothetical protein